MNNSIPLALLLDGSRTTQILELINGETPSDDYFTHFLYCYTSSYAFDFSLAASIFLACHKENLIIEKLSDVTIPSMERKWVYTLLKGFFTPAIFLQTELLNSRNIPRLITFQHKYFSPDLIDVLPHTFRHFNDLFFSIKSKNHKNNILEKTLDFMKFIHPFEFDFFVHSYNSLYSQMLMEIIPATSSFLTPKIHAKFFTEFKKLDLICRNIAYDHLSNIYHKTIIWERSHPFFIALFNNPEFCSLAFKEQHPKFLMFCEPKKFIPSNPELFAI